MALTKEEVVAAAEALVAEGKHPTQESVRAACGNRGSYATINKYLSQWKAAREAEKITIATELSETRREQGLTFIAAMYADIRKEFEAELSRRVADNARREAELKAALDEAAGEAERVVEERDGALELLKREQGARAAEQAELAAERETYRVLLKEHAILEARLAEAEKSAAHFTAFLERFVADGHQIPPQAATEAEQRSA